MFNTIKTIIKSSVPQNNLYLSSSKNLYSNDPSNVSIKGITAARGGGGRWDNLISGIH